ncbi:MAG: flagellar biosynthetic protein FliR [Chloroflexota bacterium]
MTLNVTIVSWEAFLLVMVRVAAMLMVAPAFGAKPIPAQVKIGLAALLAALITPLQTTEGPLLVDMATILLQVSREVVVGLLAGFSATLVFSAVQMAAQIIGVQVGYSFSNTVDPVTAQSAGFLDTFYTMLAVVIFMGLGGHHALISGIAQSFQLVPIGTYAAPIETGDKLVAIISNTFLIAVRLSMPIVGTMFLVDATMALVVRSIPQMNVFAVGLPVKMVLGIVVMIAFVPAIVAGISDISRSSVAAFSGILP